MGFISNVVGAFKTVKDLVTKAIGQINEIVGVFINIKDYTIGSFTAATDLIHEIEDEYNEIINFKFKPAWQYRVINIPTVIDKITELAKLPTRIIDAVKDLINNFRGRFTALEIEEATEEFLPVLGQILGVATLIAQILLAIKDTINDLKTIVDAIKTVREDIENLDLVFLTQKNPRRREKLDDGGVINIRVGSLHPE